uniref:Uncharacterized protein n=1 Tax=Rhizophora mucronata TaxID=61149 RepID=A0A2P2JDR7_RHIMU
MSKKKCLGSNQPYHRNYQASKLNTKTGLDKQQQCETSKKQKASTWDKPRTLK